ncbi:uncharacterized protein LOC109835017 [Asparagus officinalis]|uniref:uncharacterized protein LOC109835017 n=1 Tax=Asparagus officinalis TaxID=4686 RepID=UPI00098E5315|nr:uncharacterized protein LOC109835017 [Asparagus officinalis]
MTLPLKKHLSKMKKGKHSSISKSKSSSSVSTPPIHSSELEKLEEISVNCGIQEPIDLLGSWNVRGLNKPSKRRLVRECLSLAKVNLVGLQESKLSSPSSFLLKSLGGRNISSWISLDATDSRGGVLLGRDDDLFSCSSSSIDIFFVSATLTHRPSNWRFVATTIYAPCDSSEREVCWWELDRIRGSHSLPWVVFGDFNMTLSTDERSGRPSSIRDIKSISNLSSQIHALNICEESRNLSPQEIQLRSDMKDQILSLAKAEEIKWKQRSRIQWLKEGDNNSAFFHKVASYHRRKKFVPHLLINDSIISSDSAIKDSFFSFFSNLFGQAPASRLSPNWSTLYPNENFDLSSLDLPFSPQEITEAVFDLNPDKSPRPDGLPILFFQRFWPVVQADVIEFIQGIYSHPQCLNNINYSHICLIPKKEGASSPKDFRPISLINSSCKIFSKILTNRLKKVLHNLIDNSQSAFQAGKSSLDSFLLGHEMVNFCSSGKKEVCAFKVDFYKAFDCVNWSFLLSLLKARGFGPKWCLWIQYILSSSKSAVLVNGSPTKFFRCFRGLKQGDPLSPLLFLLVADVLSKLLYRSAALGDLSDLNLKGQLNSIRLIQFADDTIIFSKATPSDMATLNAILHIFANISGLHVNHQKSNLFYLGKIPHKGKKLAKILSCSVGSLPFSYLGLPLKRGSLSKREWQPLLESFTKKLSLWKNKSLSIGGSFTKKLSLWKNKSLSIGGRNSHISKVFFFVYSKDGFNPFAHPIKSTASSFFKDLSSIQTTFFNLVKWNIGDGRTGNFWHDKWSSENSLCSLFPKAFILALSQSCCIRSQGRMINNAWSWHPLTRRGISHSERSDLNHLLSLLTSSNINITSEPDELWWMLLPSGTFSVKSYYSFVNSGGIKSKFSKLIWKSPIPSKVKVLFWIISNKKLNTKANLIHKGWAGDPRCAFCKSEVETHEHIFLKCSFARAIWSIILPSVPTICWPETIEELIMFHKSPNLCSDMKTVWRILLPCFCWWIWFSRNVLIFKDSQSNPLHIASNIGRYTIFWTGAADERLARRLRRAASNIGLQELANRIVKADGDNLTPSSPTQDSP